MKTILLVTSVAAALAVSPLQADTFTFGTLAGAAFEKTGDGLGSAARFVSAYNVAMDGAGNIYVADLNNHTVRKITTNGFVSTVAGMPGASGSVDGMANSARFNGPNAVAVDSSNNVYVTEVSNSTIRKITPTGVVTTLAGLAGTTGSANGTGSAARFNVPSGVATDANGNVYVADTFNYTIRKVTPEGVVSTLAGLAGVLGSADGTGSNARFDIPIGLAVDSSNNVYVADQNNHTIRMITSAGVVSTLVGLAGAAGSTDGAAGSARFNAPVGVAADSSGNLYVADFFNSTIRRITPARVVSTWAGLAGFYGNTDGTAGSARFSNPTGVAAGSSGNVVVADYGNNTVRKITPTRVVSTLAGRAGGAGTVNGSGSAAKFNGPNSVTVDASGNVYVADETGNTIRKVTSAGSVTTLAGLANTPGSANGTGSAARFDRPEGVGVDYLNNVYVADQNNHTIRKITPAGVVSTFAGLAGQPGSANGTGTAARFNQPSSVAADGAGNLYVADYANNTIRKITPAGEVSTLAGLAGAAGSANGTSSDARFDAPYGVAVDASTNVYVAEVNNSTIRKITPEGEVSTLAGLAGVLGSDDGVGDAARFNGPNAVAIDSSNNVYVADSSNFTIRKIKPDGEVSTVGGVVNAAGSADGTDSAARFFYPYGIAVDGAGNLYVADFQNNTVRKGIPTSLLPPPVLRAPVLDAGQFGFGITGVSGFTMNIESSADFANWQAVGEYILEGGTNYFHGGAQVPGNQFYRARAR